MQEKVSEYIHEEWMTWAKTMLKHEKLSPARIERWENECFKPYSELSEEMKDLDRMFATKIVDIVKSSNIDQFMSVPNSVDRLFMDYIKHENLFIAFDFDHTVYDFNQDGSIFPKMEEMLLFLKKEPEYKLILFTAREGEKLDFAINYCKERGYEPDYVNENPIMNTRKPYYNLLLDDRAGLGEAYNILHAITNFIIILKNKLK